MATEPDSQSPWSTILALIGVVVVVAVAFVLLGPQFTESPEDDVVAEDVAEPDVDPSPQPEPSGGTQTPTDAPTSGPTADPELVSEVGILNGSGIDGLGEQARERLTEGGWPVAVVDTSSNPPEVTTIFYPEGLQESAEALAEQFPEIEAVEPSGPGLTQQRMVLILTEDYADVLDQG